MTTQNSLAPVSGARDDDFEPVQALRLSRAPVIVRYVASFVLTGLATVIAIGLDTNVAVPNLSLVFVIPVVIAAVTMGLGPSLCSAILGALSYNFFLTEPRYSLAVDDPANIWAIALLFVVGCIASAVASIARGKADDARMLREQAAILQLYSREAVASDDSKSIISITADSLEKLFHVPVVVMIMSETEGLHVERRGEIAVLNDIEMQAAQSALTDRRPIPASVYPFDDSRFDFWPVVAPAGQRAVIGLAFDPDERPRAPGIPVEILGNLLALALDGQRIADPKN